MHEDETVDSSGRPQIEEYTLDRLLDDEDLVQELRNFNPRLLKLYSSPSLPPSG